MVEKAFFETPPCATIKSYPAGEPVGLIGSNRVLRPEINDD